MDTYSTGYYGIPGGRAGGNVHVLKNGKPMCGYRPHPKAEFQWASNNIHLPYVECRRCLERATPIVLNESLEMARQDLKNASRWNKWYRSEVVKRLEKYIAEKGWK